MRICHCNIIHTQNRLITASLHQSLSKNVELAPSLFHSLAQPRASGPVRINLASGGHSLCLYLPPFYGGLMADWHAAQWERTNGNTMNSLSINGVARLAYRTPIGTGRGGWTASFSPRVAFYNRVIAGPLWAHRLAGIPHGVLAANRHTLQTIMTRQHIYFV